jgi:hypothetical protein
MDMHLWVEQSTPDHLWLDSRTEDCYISFVSHNFQSSTNTSCLATTRTRTTMTLHLLVALILVLVLLLHFWLQGNRSSKMLCKKICFKIEEKSDTTINVDINVIAAELPWNPTSGRHRS